MKAKEYMDDIKNHTEAGYLVGEWDMEKMNHKTIEDVEELFRKWALKKNKDDNGSMIYVNHITEFLDQLEKLKL